MLLLPCDSLSGLCIHIYLCNIGSNAVVLWCRTLLSWWSSSIEPVWFISSIRKLYMVSTAINFLLFISIFCDSWCTCTAWGAQLIALEPRSGLVSLPMDNMHQNYEWLRTNVHSKLCPHRTVMDIVINIYVMFYKSLVELSWAVMFLVWRLLQLQICCLQQHMFFTWVIHHVYICRRHMNG